MRWIALGNASGKTSTSAWSGSYSEICPFVNASEDATVPVFEKSNKSARKSRATPSNLFHCCNFPSIEGPIWKKIYVSLDHDSLQAQSHESRLTNTTLKQQHLWKFPFASWYGVLCLEVLPSLLQSESQYRTVTHRNFSIWEEQIYFQSFVIWTFNLKIAHVTPARREVSEEIWQSSVRLLTSSFVTFPDASCSSMTIDGIRSSMIFRLSPIAFHAMFKEWTSLNGIYVMVFLSSSLLGQPGFPWIKGISHTKPPFRSPGRVRSLQFDQNYGCYPLWDDPANNCLSFSALRLSSTAWMQGLAWLATTPERRPGENVMWNHWLFWFL